MNLKIRRIPVAGGVQFVIPGYGLTVPMPANSPTPTVLDVLEGRVNLASANGPESLDKASHPAYRL